MWESPLTLFSEDPEYGRGGYGTNQMIIDFDAQHTKNYRYSLMRNSKMTIINNNITNAEMWCPQANKTYTFAGVIVMRTDI